MRETWRRAAVFVMLVAMTPAGALAVQRAAPSASNQPTATTGRSSSASPRRLTGDEIDAVNRKDSETALLLDLRPLRTGESKALGHLTRIDCAAGGAVRVYVKTDTATLMASAPKLQSIELRTYRGDKEFMLGCGARPASDRVYLTWRAAAAAPASPGGRQVAASAARGSASTTKSVGTAVALEFLPANYVPSETAK